MLGVPLQFVVGKGGVGKSTLAAALAIRAAAHGRRTLAVEFGGVGGLSRIFASGGAPAAAVGVPREVRPGLVLLSLGGDEALAEYLSMVLPVRRLLSAVFASRLYRVFVDAAPGLKELMTVGKVWYEVDRRVDDGNPAWDTVVVDAGASGHSLQYLQMPAAAAETFRSGLVHRESMRVGALLSDPSRTCVHVVSTPEEMPVTEAVSIVARLRGELALPLGGLFLNRCRARPPSGAAAAVDLLRRAVLEPGDGILRDSIVEAADAFLGWEKVQEAAASRLEAGTGMTARRLPLLVGEEFALAQVESLARLLDAPRDASPATPRAAAMRTSRRKA